MRAEPRGIRRRYREGWEERYDRQNEQVVIQAELGGRGGDGRGSIAPLFTTLRTFVHSTGTGSL